MLDANLKNQVREYLQLLEREVVILLSRGDDENSKKLSDFVEEISSLSDKLSVVEEDLKFKPSFKLTAEGVSGVSFAGIPLGHEFESFILALLQVGGRTPKIEQEQIQMIKSIDKELDFETIVSLSCHNCPEVVQALNIMAVLNPKITHTMVEGSFFQDYVEELDIMSVPTTLLNGEAFNIGKTSLDKILEKVIGDSSNRELNIDKTLDMLIVGAGVAGATSAIYAARKGLDVAMVAKEYGGQVEDTSGIENITGIEYIEGPKYMESIRSHLDKYEVSMYDDVEALEIVEGSPLKLKTNRGEISAKSIIIATGARWKSMGVPGEEEFKNKGVAYCTHCDGPLFKDKKVAVIGGGNSGVEAAIELSTIAKEIILLQRSDKLKADSVLQEKLKEISNIRVVTNADTKALKGDSTLKSIEYENRLNGEVMEEAIDGCFIQIGLVPNTEWINNVEKNKFGEILVDRDGATNIEGVYSAGDCTDCAFKQIVIAQGSGATASLGAYNYLMRL